MRQDFASVSAIQLGLILGPLQKGSLVTQHHELKQILYALHLYRPVMALMKFSLIPLSLR